MQWALLQGITLHNNPSRSCGWLGRYGWERMDFPPYSPDLAPRDFNIFGALSSTWLASDLYQTPKASCHLLAADTWFRYLLGRDTSLGTTVRQMLKCQWWLRRSLVCTICYPCAMCTSKSEWSYWHPVFAFKKNCFIVHLYCGSVFFFPEIWTLTHNKVTLF
jgi:hypothetical protein